MKDNKTNEIIKALTKENFKLLAAMDTYVKNKVTSEGFEEFYVDAASKLIEAQNGGVQFEEHIGQSKKEYLDGWINKYQTSKKSRIFATLRSVFLLEAFSITCLLLITNIIPTFEGGFLFDVGITPALIIWLLLPPLLLCLTKVSVETNIKYDITGFKNVFLLMFVTALIVIPLSFLDLSNEVLFRTGVYTLYVVLLVPALLFDIMLKKK